MTEVTVPFSAWTLFRQRDFSLFCASRFLWGLALQMQNVAVGWLVYDLTHSPFALGLAGLSAFVPVVVLTLAAGHIADQFDRRMIIAASLALAALSSTGLLLCVLSGTTQTWPIYALVALMGTSRAFGNPANHAFLPSLVPPPMFATAVAWNTSMFQTASILGPAVGGLLYALGPMVVFTSAATAFSTACLCVLLIRYRREPPQSRKVTWGSLVAGIAFIRSRQVLLGAISLDLFAVLLGGATALLPIFAQDVLHTGPWGLGLLRSMPGLGAVLMSVALAQWPLRRRVGRRMFTAVAIFGLATIGFGLSTSLPLSLACLLVLGAADTVSVVIRQTLVQTETPDEMRGRVSAVNSVFIGASNELGEFESGALAALVGAVGAVVLGGVGTIAIALLWVRVFPQLWNRERLVAD